MIDFSPEMATLLMFVLLIGLLSTGYPLALVLGGSALILGFLGVGWGILDTFYLRSYAAISEYTFLAIPLFVFMAIMVERSGVSEKLFSTLFILMGRIRGSLAIVTILTGTVLAATMGIFSAAVVMLGLAALPPMMARGYQKEISCGAICASGCLGILIPPSIMLILYGPMAGISVGKMFMAAIPSGLTLSALYIAYIVIRCWIDPNLCPVPSKEEKRQIPLAEKMRMLLTTFVPPVILIGSVLGSIFFGVATPTEAAGVGATASLFLAAGYGGLTLKTLKETTYHTLKVSSMIILLVIGGFMFSGAFMSLGCGDIVEKFILAAPFGRWGSFAIIMFIVFILGMFIDWVGILLIMIPIVTPIAAKLGFDQLWFAMMICISLQIAYLSPPYAPAIFFLRGVCPPEYGINTNTIIRGCIPFIGLIALGLGLMIVFPEIITWLPNMMIK